MRFNLDLKFDLLKNQTRLLLCSLISFFSLMYSYIISDFSLLNVFQNSQTTKPLLYKISGVWGNHEGSMLLWVLVLSITNYFIYRLYNKKNYFFISKTLQFQSLIILGFLFLSNFSASVRLFLSMSFIGSIPGLITNIFSGFTPISVAKFFVKFEFETT